MLDLGTTQIVDIKIISKPKKYVQFLMAVKLNIKFYFSCNNIVDRTLH